MFDAIINLFRGKRHIDTPRVYEAIDVARFIINYENEAYTICYKLRDGSVYKTNF